MASPPVITDRAALERNRARARPEALFLHHLAADEVDERLKDVNRTFTKPAVVSGQPQPWRRFGPVVVDAAHLSLEPGAHDLVIHGLSLHWADDPVGALIQCRRALRPDGFFVAALFGGATLAGLRTALADAEAQVTGGASPRVLPMADIRDLGNLLQRAGFALPVADVLPIRAAYADTFALMHELRFMGEGNALAARLRQPTRRAVLQQAARNYARAHPAPEGGVQATFEIVFLSGWAPGPGQPQPLRPGAAERRLADALGVAEINPEREPHD